MTLRDLFRWGERYRLATDIEKTNGKQLLAENGIKMEFLEMLLNYIRSSCNVLFHYGNS